MLAGADLRECHFYGAVMRRPDFSRTLHSIRRLSLIDSSRNKTKVDPEYSSYVQPRRTYPWRTLTPM